MFALVVVCILFWFVIWFGLVCCLLVRFVCRADLLFVIALVYSACNVVWLFEMVWLLVLGGVDCCWV